MKKYDLRRIVIGVDPAMTHHKKSDETGIIVAGVGYDKCAYILDDLSGRYSPHGWASHVAQAYHFWMADRVVAEINAGGDMIKATLHGVDPSISFKGVRATRGKALRAEPVAALYEQGRVFHVCRFPILEQQMNNFDPGAGGASPDRVDALVWALTDLMLTPDSMPPHLWVLNGLWFFQSCL